MNQMKDTMTTYSSLLPSDNKKRMVEKANTFRTLLDKELKILTSSRRQSLINK